MKSLALRYILFEDGRKMDAIGDESAQLVVLTPPYVNHHGEKNKAQEAVLLKQLMAECARVVTPDGVVATINTDFRDQGMIYLRHIAVAEAARSAGLVSFDEKIWVRGFKRDLYRKKFSFVFVWSKGKRVLHHHSPDYERDNWVFTKSQQIGDFRDAVAPEIPRLLIGNYTVPGDLVVSVCAGSGTVVIEALKLDRRAVGYEINPKMRSVIIARETAIADYYSLQGASLE
jgi:ubiquinone/menaquinone biosynthesis C-methylase UbiE